MKAKYGKTVLLMLLAAVLVTGCAAPATITVNGVRLEAMTDGFGGRPETESAGAQPGEPDVQSVPETEPPEQSIAVYVCGAVEHPAVVRLPAGARVCDALEAAGGFTPGADTEWLNQARVLADGEMLRVYTREETVARRESGIPNEESGAAVQGAEARTPAASEDGRVNLNTAAKEELMTLPGIGGAKAEAILRYREENGPFAACEDVMRISGIKTSIYEKIRDRITI